jgi:DNA polymerase-3 subunit beta
MRFTCPVHDLQSALGTAIKALSARPSAPILEGVLLETTSDGIQLTCSDLSLSIETSSPAAVLEEGRVVLPGKLLSEVIRKLPPAAVDITVDDARKTVIRCAGSRTTLTGLSPDEYPEIPRVQDGVGVTLNQGLLQDMIQKTSFAAALDESQPIYTGCLLETESGGLTMVALDGFRMAYYHVPTEQETDFRAVIPGKILSELSRVLGADEESVSLELSSSRACFTVQNAQSGSFTRLTARLLEGEFIQYRQIIPAEWQTSLQVDTHPLADAIERAGLIARESKSNLVRFHVEPDLLQITSNAELGEICEEIQEIEVEGKGLDIAFNVRYLSDALKVISDEKVRLHFQSSISPCVILPPEGDAYLYLILPVRVYTS